MYEESRNAIREYVQNGFDSIQRAIYELKLLKPGEGLIHIIFDDDLDGITIRDNGAGLPVSLANQILTSIGASRKDYRSDAGFRGIGRLAGIVFSDTVSFRTKAAGEAEETEVTFNAALMRELMSPGKGSALTAEALLVQCVRCLDTRNRSTAPALLRGEGCAVLRNRRTNVSSQSSWRASFPKVAPVPYREEFEHRIAIHAHADEFGIGIEEVALVIEAPGQAPQRVFKPYSARYEVRDAEDLVPLAEVQYFKSPTDRWWGWLGKKAEPGSYP